MRLTPLVGRDTELAAITSAAAQSRLLTLTGPGGTGKTRLALAVAAALAASVDDTAVDDTAVDVAWVELAPLYDAQVVAPAVAARLGVPETPGTHPAEAIAAHLAARRDQFVELGSHNDRTFSQFLGINNNGRIAGYFGSGAAHHPNKGYLINAPYAQGDVKCENFPHSVQTQVTGLNDGGVQVGFYSTQNTVSGVDNNFGWYFNGSFHRVVFPTGSKPQADD